MDANKKHQVTRKNVFKANHNTQKAMSIYSISFLCPSYTNFLTGQSISLYKLTSVLECTAYTQYDSLVIKVCT